MDSDPAEEQNSSTVMTKPVNAVANEDGDRQETAPQERGDDAETTTAPSINGTDGGAHKSFRVTRGPEHSQGGHHLPGEDDYVNIGLEMQNSTGNIKMHVINEDYSGSSVRQQQKAQITKPTSKSPTTIKQIQQQVDAEIQQQRKLQESRHRQHAAGTQIQQMKQLSQPPTVSTKKYKNRPQETLIQMKHSGPTLSVQSQQQTTVKIKQKKGRFSVLENCNTDDKTSPQLAANTNHSSSIIPSQQRQNKAGFDNSAKPSRSSPTKNSRSRSTSRARAVPPGEAEKTSANGITAGGGNTAPQSTVPSTTKTPHPVQYSNSDPNLSSVATEKKGRFIISNSIDACKVQQQGGKLSNKNNARSQFAGETNNQQRRDSDLCRKKKTQQSLDIPQLSLQGHTTNDYVTSNGGAEKGRFIISNSVDACKAQQQVAKLSNKSTARPQSGGATNNQQRFDSVPCRKKKTQQSLDIPQLSLQGHKNNDYGPSNGGAVINMKVSSPKKIAPDKMPHSLLEKTSSLKALNGSSTAPTTTTSSHAPTGGVIKGSMGNMFHFMEQMKLEVLETDKIIRSLQSDNKFLRGKNKEFVAKLNDADRMYAEEKLARESAELKIKALMKRLSDAEGNHAVNSEQQVTLESNEIEPAFTNNGTGGCHGADNDITAKRSDVSQNKLAEMHLKQNESLKLTDHKHRFRRRRSSEERAGGIKGTTASTRFRAVETVSSSPPNSRGSPNVSGLVTCHHSVKLEVVHNNDYGTLQQDVKTEVTNASLELLQSTTKAVLDSRGATGGGTTFNCTSVETVHSTVQRETSPLVNSIENSLATFDPLSTNVKQPGSREHKTVETTQLDRFDSCFSDDHPQKSIIFCAKLCATETNEGLNPGKKFDPYEIN